MAVIIQAVRTRSDHTVTAKIDGIRLPYVFERRNNRQRTGSARETILGQTRLDSQGFKDRWELQTRGRLYYDEYLDLLRPLERKAGSDVRFWLDEWPDRHWQQDDIDGSTSEKFVLAIDNGGPLVWPRFHLTNDSAGAITALSIERRGPNLVLNAGAEDDDNGNSEPDNWTSSGSPGWESGLVYSGRKSFRVTSTDTWEQTMDVEPGVYYLAAARIMAEKSGAVSHGDLLEITWLDSGGSAIGSPVSTTETLIQNWPDDPFYHTALSPSTANGDASDAAQAKLTLKTDQTDAAIYDEVFFGPVNDSSSEPNPWVDGESESFVLDENIGAGSELEIVMHDEVAQIDQADATLDSSSQFWPIQGGRSQIVVTVTASTVDCTLTTDLSWERLCNLEFDDAVAQWGADGSWERWGRRLNLDLEAVRPSF